MPNGGRDQRFPSTTRGQVLGILWRTPRTVEELAATLGVTDNAVRSHPSSLERDGQVRQSGVRRAQGKPAHVYDVTPAAERLFPKAYGPVLGYLLDVLGERRSADALEALLREVGSRLATEAGGSAHRGHARAGSARCLRAPGVGRDIVEIRRDCDAAWQGTATWLQLSSGVCRGESS